VVEIDGGRAEEAVAAVVTEKSAVTRGAEAEATAGSAMAAVADEATAAAIREVVLLSTIVTVNRHTMRRTINVPLKSVHVRRPILTTNFLLLLLQR
jgi:hypothetical protein